ncbi:UBX domain-containing protein 10-like [Watersipora subatra]|uniref:UBX domain-containing protein 10-like n=1 Tax=Watersipora subatra TaxID=2589382 RepID=UPI00355C867C
MYRRRNTTPVSTPEELSAVLQPTPPPKRPTSSSSSRPESGASSGSRHDSGSSRSSLTELSRLSRQNSLLAPLSSEINFDMLPDATKTPNTIGRHHTIVPPIKRPVSEGRPISCRSNSIMAETPIPLNLSASDEFNNDDHAISSIKEENDPSSTPRLANPLVSPRYIQTPVLVKQERNNNIETVSKPSDKPQSETARLSIAVKLLDGTRVVEYFRPCDKLHAVLNFAGKRMNKSLNGYSLRSATCNYRDMMTTLEECEIQDKTLLQLVQPDS